MAQVWDTKAYEKNASFVHGMAVGVLEWLDAKAGERVLDLGCGDGQLTQKIAATGAIVAGADASPQMVEAARGRGIDAQVAQAESLPFADASFDAVFSNAALHWVRGQDAMMAEVHRVLKPGGRFVAEMGGHGNVAAIRVAFMAVLTRHGFGGREEDENYYPTPEEYTGMLDRNGFAVERIALIPRATPLGKDMGAWFRTFRSGVLNTLPAELRDVVVNETVALLAPALRDREGNWTGDYVRLRFIARV
jgi:ubiquinone/menaquinone biosynthesis C-methylase UbiE